MTRILSESTTVLILCAMVRTVQSRKCRRMVSWMSLSVLLKQLLVHKASQCHLYISTVHISHIGSTLAVASSMTSTFLFLRSALARHSSCLWPTDRLEPPVLSSEESPPLKEEVQVDRWTCREK